MMRAPLVALVVLVLAGLVVAAMLGPRLMQSFAHPPQEEPAMTADPGTPPALTDLAGLGARLVLTPPPNALRYVETRPQPGADDRTLCALLDYADAATADSLLAAGGVTHPEGGILPFTLPDWMAEALGPAIELLPDGLAATTAPIHGVGPFARSPYLQGFAMGAGPGRIALCLYTT